MITFFEIIAALLLVGSLPAAFFNVEYGIYLILVSICLLVFAFVIKYEEVQEQKEK